jgi:hypothetical protein
VPQPQRRVAEDDQIEHTEVARSSEDRLGRRGDPQPADQVHRERLRVAAHQQPRPPGTGIGVEHGSEDRVRDGGQHPPAPEPSGRQVRECRGSGQHQLPRRQFFELRTAQTRGVYPSSDAFPFPTPQPCPGGRAWSALYSHAGKHAYAARNRSRLQRICGGAPVLAPSCGNRSLATGLLAKPVTITCLLARPVSCNLKMDRLRVGGDRFRHVEEWRAKRSGKTDQAADTRVTSTEMGPSVSIQLTSPVIRPTARRSGSTACRCARAPGVP